METVVLEGRKPALQEGVLECRVETSYDSLAPMRAEWDEAVLRLRGPIYMSFDWTRLWWQFYGGNRSLRLFVFRVNGGIVGIVPIYIDSIGGWPLRLRVARLVGACIPPKVFDPPIETTWARGIWLAVLESLFRSKSCDFFSLGPVDGDYQALGSLVDACQQSNLAAVLEGAEGEVHTVYHLPQSYEAYFSSLDGKERKVRRKKLRELEALSPVSSEVVSEGTRLTDEFERFAEQHRLQWEAEGRPGHFHAWPNALNYNRALVSTLGPIGRARFFNLKVGEEVVCRQYAFAFGGTLFAELPSRVNGARWHKLSLGCTSQIKLIESAIAGRFNVMESGLGHYDYKILTGGKERPVRVLRVARRGAANRLRVAAFGGLSAASRLVLQKVWHRRIMPRLPAKFHTGQSRLQLRLDF